MNKLLYSLFVSIFLFDYISKSLGSLGVLGRYITWYPELLSMLIILVVSGRFMLGATRNVPPKWFLFLALYLLNIIIGIAINSVPAGPLIAGFRAYLKFIPFFLLPFVYHFSSQQIGGQLKLILFFFIIQAPVALYQRLVVSKGLLTGDYVKGTLSSSGQLTVVLSCAIAVLISFYLAKKISLTTAVVIFFLLFIPMTINETKATIVLLPIALILPFYFSPHKIKLEQLIPMIILGIFTTIAFVFIYDYFMRPRWGYGIIGFLTMEGRAENYLFKGHDYNFYAQVGKVDSFVIAFKTISKDLLSFFFGFGIGNVSESFVPWLSGEYAEKYSAFNVKTTVLTIILWELGVFGVISYYVLYLMILKDSKGLCTDSDITSTLSQGWRTVVVIIMVATAYANFLQENATGYLFWYLSGYIISENYWNKVKAGSLKT
ncbi:MAG: hypothetical protein V3V33_02450 [Candidatus Lokiarchaeia archaeon]